MGMYEEDVGFSWLNPKFDMAMITLYMMVAMKYLNILWYCL
jgi:hypothetical protein